MRSVSFASMTLAVMVLISPLAFAGPIDDGQALIKSVSADTATLAAALDNKTLKLKDPSQAASLKPLVIKCAATYAKAWKLVLSVPRPQRGAPAYKALLTAVGPLKMAVTVAGYAMPGAFYSPNAVRLDRNVRSTSQYSMDYVKESKLHDARNYFQRAYRSYKTMGAQDRASANGVALLDTLFKNQRAINARARQLKQQQQMAGQARQYCAKVKTQFSAGKRKRWLNNLHALASGQVPTNINGPTKPGLVAWAAQSKCTLAMLKELKPICDDAAKRPMLEQCVPAHSRPRMTGLYAKDDPINWCSYVPRGVELLSKQIEATAAKNAQLQAISNAGGDDVERLERNEGWFSTDGLGTWKDKFSLSDKYKADTIAQFKGLYAALGVKLDNTDVLFGSTLKSLKALEAQARRLAPKWGKPEGRGKHYGIKLGKKQIKRVFGKVKFYSTGGTQGWTIKKNGLGVPLYRDQVGWAIFQVKGDPFCQARSFSLSETYAGGGRYKKARGVRFGSARWQRCL
ncbi:MAG TPA: hypothetical protein DCQ06_09635 [Myxococcales bacterium]|nr:hypothetical protein [Myxococcales bacterium]